MGEQAGEGGGRETERETETETDRHRQRETESVRDRDTHTETERHTERQRETQREEEREGGKEREREVKSERERERVNSYVQVLTDAVNVHTFDTNTQPLLEMPPQNHLHATQSSPSGSHVINITILDRHHHLHRQIVIEIPS